MIEDLIHIKFNVFPVVPTYCSYVVRRIQAVNTLFLQENPRGPPEHSRCNLKNRLTLILIWATFHVSKYSRLQ